MAGIVWITDPHLNFLDPEQVEHLLHVIDRRKPTAVLIGGDIGESQSVVGWLTLLAERIAAPIYFVLGNHDFYHGSIREVRRRVEELCEQFPHLTYLTASGCHSLLPGEAILGHDGWADARVGDYLRSYVMMNDYRLIEELSGVNKMDRRPLLEALGREAARHVARVLPEALRDHEHAWLLTHVPPLREACWYDGRISDDEWAPHFTCLSVGETILRIMAEHPDRRLTVLCGHTHGEGECRPAPNVRILTGPAEYGAPRVTRYFDLPET